MAEKKNEERDALGKENIDKGGTAKCGWKIGRIKIILIVERKMEERKRQVFNNMMSRLLNFSFVINKNESQL